MCYNIYGDNMENKSKKQTKREIVKMLLKQDIPGKDEQELLEALIDEPIAVDIEKQEDSDLSLGDRLADKVASVAGSWSFIIFFCSFLLIWIIINGIFLIKALDPFPFILLNLVLSCIAAIQAPIIMMSQNRQEKKDTLRNKNDYRIDLKSELILEDLHDKMTTLIKNQEKIIKYINDSDSKE